MTLRPLTPHIMPQNNDCIVATDSTDRESGFYEF